MINLRPNKLEDMIGQQEIIERLKITVAAAKHKQENLAHILLNGPPGLGKTTLAGAIADAMGLRFVLRTEVIYLQLKIFYRT